ncbi:MAG TPA: DUF58 domain-containing protein [Polyangiaceae bacterium]|nr:DUF58 domain-containing protein [Polyangiaceae bacterium]
MKLREAIDWGKLAPLRLHAKVAADGVYAGAHRSVRRGAGVEFGGHRNYVPGDDLRFLDRHARMRHGLLLVREFETETDRALRLIVDASASMGFKSEQALAAKYAYAAVIAAALGRVAVVRGDRVALDFIGGGNTVPLPSTGGREAFERLVGHLESAAPTGDADVKTLERALAPTARYARRGAAVVVLSDLIDLPDDAPDLLAGLSAGGRALVVVQVLDPVEQTFPFQGAVALRALEGASFVETEAEGVRAQYLAALAALQKSWEQRLLGRGARLLLVSSAEEPTEVVRRVLLALSEAGESARGAA